MIKYIVFLLDNASTSFCHYDNTNRKQHLMPIEILQKGIRFAMMENLNIQFVYSNYSLPQNYLNAIDTIDHVNIVPKSYKGNFTEGIMVLEDFDYAFFKKGIAYVLRINRSSLFKEYKKIPQILNKVDRLNIVITDIVSFTEKDFQLYSNVLKYLVNELSRMFIEKRNPQLNLLTDRLFLNKMNNCGAGDTTITLAPDGNFYVCPAFYYTGICNGKEETEYDVCQKGYSIGSIEKGLNIKNPQLYNIDHAPICQHCDAWQCKRCIWLNRKSTMEVNTPSHEQCVVAHLERNASRELLYKIRKQINFISGKEIKEINYLDPFYTKEDWH